MGVGSSERWPRSLVHGVQGQLGMGVGGDGWEAELYWARVLDLRR
jgi:hypothetical protein